MASANRHTICICIYQHTYGWIALMCLFEVRIICIVRPTRLGFHATSVHQAATPLLWCSLRDIASLFCTFSTSVHMPSMLLLFQIYFVWTLFSCRMQIDFVWTFFSCRLIFSSLSRCLQLHWRGEW
jgi:hypothetical protein